MIKDLLPIGSVVLLREGKKRVMIFGVKQSAKENGKEYDYIAVLYPEGHLGQEFQFMFDESDIIRVDFRGYEDQERDEFIEKLSEVYKEKA